MYSKIGTMELDVHVRYEIWCVADKIHPTIQEMILSRLLQQENVHQWETCLRRREKHGVLWNKGVTEGGLAPSGDTEGARPLISAFGEHGAQVTFQVVRRSKVPDT